MTNSRTAKFWQQIEAARQDLNPEEPAPKFPLKMGVAYHDGPGAQFWDADGKPVLVDLIREPELAVQIEWLLGCR